jgi:hypothetical protein
VAVTVAVAVAIVVTTEVTITEENNEFVLCLENFKLKLKLYYKIWIIVLKA